MVSYGSSWNFNAYLSILDFELPLKFPMQRNHQWTGYGSQEISPCDLQSMRIFRMTATILHNAKINYGIFTNIENNLANDIRRIGEEGLYDELVQRNFSLLQVGHYKGNFYN